jgi:hypothetical protein
MDPRISFKQHVDETLAEAWERYHDFMIDIPTISLEDWKFKQRFYCGLSQEAKEHIDVLAGGIFFILHTKKARVLFDKLSASKRESEEYGLKKNSLTVKIDTLTRKFRDMALIQPAASEMYQAE